MAGEPEPCIRCAYVRVRDDEQVSKLYCALDGNTIDKRRELEMALAAPEGQPPVCAGFAIAQQGWQPR